MIARISSTFLLAACALWPSALSAQWMPPQEQPPMMGYAPESGPIQLAQGYAPQPGMDYYGDGSEYGGQVYAPGPLPWERDGDSPFRKFLKEVMPNTYFQMEYLSWNIDDIGAGAVGAGTLLTPDVRNPLRFGLFDVDNFTGQDFRVPTTEPISFEKLSGLKGTFGVPLTIGTFEISAFALEDGEAGIRNNVPGFRTFQPFTVPTNVALIVPPPVGSLNFPVGVRTVAIPNTPFTVYAPPLVVPGTPIIQPVIPGDIVAGGTVFIAGTSNAAVIPLLQNGQPSFTALIYDVGYAASYRNETWGTEAKLVLDYGPDQNGMTIKPLVGFRYMSFDEQFQQVGVSSLSSNVLRGNNILFVGNNPIFLPVNVPGVLRGPQYTSVIESEVQNTLYGLEVGTRTELNHKWFTLGVEPRISLGVNNYEAEVTTRNLRGPSDGLFRTQEDELIFAPVFDMTAYGRLHLSPYFSLHAGYNFTYLFRVTRPHDNIYYNDNGPSAPPGVVVNPETQDMHIQGLNIGGEFRFRDLKFRR